MSSTFTIPSVEPKSVRPSERMITTQMDRWLKLTYAYYSLAEDAPPSTPRETIAKVSHYLGSIIASLNGNNTGSVRSSTTLAIPAPSSSAAALPTAVPSASATPATAVTADSNDCQVCLEPVEGRRYGLLSQCAHKYCEQCVRHLIHQLGINWQQRALQCPTCRVSSDRVIFSDTFYARGQEKDYLLGSFVCVAHLETMRSDHLVGRTASYVDIQRGITRRPTSSW